MSRAIQSELEEQNELLSENLAVVTESFSNLISTVSPLVQPVQSNTTDEEIVRLARAIKIK